MSVWMKNFLKWLFPWTDGQKKIARSVGKIEGLVADLEKGIQLVEIEQTQDQEIMQKKIEELEAFKLRTEARIQVLSGDREKASNAVKGFRAILRGEVGSDEEQPDKNPELSETDTPDESE